MRIIVASPAKTGNVWVKLMLAEIYQLMAINEVPRIPLRFLRAFIDEGLFEENSIFHQHFRPTKPFFELMKRVDARLVTTVRHPYDVFVSLYFYVQRLSHLFHEGAPLYPLIGKELGDPAVFEYLEKDEDGFGFQVRLALEWVDCGQSIIVTYEDLMADTYQAMKGVTDRIEPVPEEVVRQAVENNQADRLKKKSLTLNKHIRTGTTGDWRNHLTRAHLEVINASQGALIQRLGYGLHEDPAV